jgi:hypothetical protein
MDPTFVTIFMSGYSGSTGLAQSDLGPPNYYIQKPFSISVLLTRVAEALSLSMQLRADRRFTRLPF